MEDFDDKNNLQFFIVYHGETDCNLPFKPE